MFTGIVQGRGKIAEVIIGDKQLRLAILLPDVTKLKIGASVAINGVCLTAVQIEGNLVWFDVISETLTRTNLKMLQPGDEVNVERSVKYGEEIGGHLLSGHIMDVGKIVEITDEPSMKISVSEELIAYIIPKGFIALDGISLTVGEVDKKGSFTIYLIPETLKITNLNKKTVGDLVNVEIDHQTQIIVDQLKK